MNRTDAPPPASEADYGAVVADLNPEDFDLYDGEVREPKRRRLQPYHVTEMGNRPKREYVIKGLFDRGAFVELYGDTNSGKTFTALDISEHIAHGWPWRGLKVRGGAVCYLAAEGGLGLEERLTAFRQHHDVDQTEVPLYIIPASIDLCSTDSDAKTLIDEIQRLGTVQLVVIDTLSRALAGGDENGPQDMGAFVGNCDRIREATGAAVLVVHHSGKDQSRGGRGHSSLKAAVDTEILVENADSLVTVTVTKQRDYPSGDRFAFKLESIEIGTDADGDPITSCVLLPAETPAEQHRSAKLTKNQATVLGLLDDFGPGGATVEDWNAAARQEGLGVKRKADLHDFRKALKDKSLIHTTADRWYVTKL